MDQGTDRASTVPHGTGAPGEAGGWRTRRVLRLAAFLAVLILAAAVAGEPILAGIGRWLIRPDPLPSAADALVVLSGDPYGLREKEAARLWREGLAPVIIVSGGQIAWETIAARVMERHLLDLGIPADAIRVEGESSSTAENALLTLPVAEALGARTVVVVTSNYHVRRARLAFRRLYEPAGIRVFVHGVPDPGFVPERWWREGRGREYGLLELMKLLWYALDTPAR